MSGQLVFDIGLHGGDDAAYYVWRGYEVIGVDANPLLCLQCLTGFETIIAANEGSPALVG